MAQLLEFHHVSIAFARRDGRLTVLADSLDLALRSGRMHCVAGPRGSGKTSVLRAAAGLLQPTSGVIAWNGENIGELSDDDRSVKRARHLAYVDQDASLLEHLTVLENTLLPAIPSRKASGLHDRALELLTELGVAELAGARPTELSRSERRRVALARAMLMEPALLILDEPTADLDRESAEELREMLGRLRDSGIALLVASGDQTLIDDADIRTSLDVRAALSENVSHRTR